MFQMACSFLSASKSGARASCPKSDCEIEIYGAEEPEEAEGREEEAVAVDQCRAVPELVVIASGALLLEGWGG